MRRSVVLRGYKPARARQAPLWGAAERKKESPGSWAHSNVLAKSPFFFKLKTAALSVIDMALRGSYFSEN